MPDYEVTAHRLNFRKGPSTDDDIISTLIDGDVVTFIEKSEDGKWYKIRNEKGVEGWVACRYLEEADTEDEPDTDHIPVEPGTIAEGALSSVTFDISGDDFGQKNLWFPKRVRLPEIDGLEMKTRGRYADNYPKGAVVHYTSGRSRKKPEGGTRARNTHMEMGIKGVKNAVKAGDYTYFVIDRDGNVFQQFPLDRYGWHAGKSKWPGVAGNVSDELVGIEVQCAGKIHDYYKKGDAKIPCPEGKYAAYFTNPDRGDAFFSEDEVCHSEKIENIQKGTYHKYSEAQEIVLTELLLWLKANNPDIFSFDLVAGHDEVSPDRKSDPGASLSMSMPKYRALLKSTYEEIESSLS